MGVFLQASTRAAPRARLANYGLVPVKVAPKLRRAMVPGPRDDLFLVVHRALRKVPRVNAVWDFIVEHAE